MLQTVTKLLGQKLATPVERHESEGPGGLKEEGELKLSFAANACLLFAGHQRQAPTCSAKQRTSHTYTFL